MKTKILSLLDEITIPHRWLDHPDIGHLATELGTKKLRFADAEVLVRFHPNDNTATIFIPGAALEQIVRQTGHELTILKLYGSVV
jgi:hypothetical protein